MTLHKKMLGVIGLTLVALIVVLYFASQVIVLGSFSEQEEQETLKNVERVRGALDDNLRSLAGTTRDWSIWDDTYNFIDDRNQDYYDANLANDVLSMVDNQLNLMVFIDSRAHIVIARGMDYHTSKPMAMPESLRLHIYPGSPLLDHQDQSSSITGLLSLPEGPLLLASEPILTSKGEGPVLGTLIFGRFLDEDALRDLAKTTLLDIALQPVDDPRMPEDFREVLPTLTEAPHTGLKALNSTVMAGYDLWNDVYGKPALILRVEMPRDIYARGQQTIQYYMFTLIVAGLVFGAVIVLLLEKLVLSRLARLKSDMGNIEASSNLSGRVTMPGSDELSSVADSINRMLSALQRSREEQREGEERYRALVEQTTEAIFVADAETGLFLEANVASQTLLGYSREELLELTLSDIAEPDVERRTTGALKSVRTTRTLHLPSERRYRRKNGSIVPVEVSDSPITYDGRDALCIVARDITERKRAEAVLRDLAMRDGLTSLYNRREMQRILKEQIERYRKHGLPAALIMLDIDHFKTVNDTYGHQVGDDVLRWIAKLVQEMVRYEDKVARYGGEELAVILPGITAEHACEAAERLRNSVAAQPFEFIQANGDEQRQVLVPITISVGIAALPDDAETEEGLLETADRALYEAKHTGRNRVVAFSSLRLGAHLRLVR